MKDNRWYNLDSEEDLDRIQYGYDRAGNRIWRHNLVAASLSEEFDEIYYYDGVHRLKEMQRGTLNGGQTALTSKTFAQCWTLDSTGNWTGFREDANGDNTWDLIQERTANGVNEITNLTNTTGPTWSSPAYNRAGNMTTIPTPQTVGLDWNTLSTEEWSDLTTDEWAGLDASLTRSATYDAWNRLVKITDNDVILSDYTYDGAKRRIAQRSYTEGTLTETRHSYYTQPAQWQVIEERLGTSPDSADADRQFVWGLRYIDDLIVRDRDTNADSTLDERLYACQDGNWNTTAIVDDSGAVQERYAYSAYGVPGFLTAGFATRTGSASDWETLYCGYRWETAAEVFHVRHRVYLDQIGVWGERDPVAYRDGPSLYVAWFVPGGVDPSGLAWMYTGLKRCYGTLHGFITLSDGVGYGYYAESHTHGGSTFLDDLATLGNVNGVVKDDDASVYPDANCLSLYLDDTCWDIACYRRTVEAWVRDQFQQYGQGGGNYNVVIGNCYAWQNMATGNHPLIGPDLSPCRHRTWSCRIFGNSGPPVMRSSSSSH